MKKFKVVSHPRKEFSDYYCLQNQDGYLCGHIPRFVPNEKMKSHSCPTVFRSSRLAKKAAFELNAQYKSSQLRPKKQSSINTDSEYTDVA